jgi:DNA-binding MarR family transcriptional regulator
MSIETDIKQKKFRSPYQRLVLNLIYTSNWLGYKQIEMFREYELTPEQYNVLRILRGQYPNPIKVSDISERMLDKNSNTSRLIDKLLLKDLVKRSSCPSDRRAVDVVINSKGLDLLKALDPKVDEWEGSLDSITHEEADIVNALLDKLRKSE